MRRHIILSVTSMLPEPKFIIVVKLKPLQEQHILDIEVSVIWGRVAQYDNHIHAMMMDIAGLIIANKKEKALLKECFFEN